MTLKTSSLTTIGALALSAGLVPAIGVSPASALVTTISSMGTGLSISATVSGIPIMVGPAFPASGVAPPPYNVTNSGTVSLPLAGLLTDVSASAFSPFPPAEIGTATGTASSLSFVLPTGAIDITATAISSTSTADPGGATGSTTITDLSGTIGGVPVSFSGTPSVNDTILTMAGLTVILNQQIPDTKETQGITTNAIAIELSNFGPGAASGSIDIGQSEASLTVIPEPATWVEMLFGAVGLLLLRARTRSKAAAAA